MTIHLRLRTLMLLAAVALIGLLLLGRAYTPAPARVFTWTDWQVGQIRQAYLAELDNLRRDTGTLADLLNAPAPDPLRGQLVAEQIAQQRASGVATLAVQRQLLVTAAQAVSDWAVGAGTRAAASQAVEQAISRLQDAGVEPK